MFAHFVSPCHILATHKISNIFIIIILKADIINNCTLDPKHNSESFKSLTSKQKLDMIKLSEGGKSNVELGSRLITDNAPGHSVSQQSSSLTTSKKILQFNEGSDDKD